MDVDVKFEGPLEKESGVSVIDILIMLLFDPFPKRQN